MSKRDAEYEYNVRVEKQKDMFCPLCNRSCQPNCVAYVKPFIVKNPAGEDHVLGGYCSAYAIIGHEK